MSDRIMKYIVIAAFTLIAVGLFFAPAWSAAEGEEGVVAGALLARIPGGGGGFYLPLKKTDVRLEVTAGVVSAEVTQRFTNDTVHPLEAVYVFPLPSRASVTGMELRVGDRIIRSVVKEREEARRTYEQAKKAGKKAALVEQERPNIFTTSVANFLPGETVDVKLTYTEPAECRQGVCDVTFPMVVGQRYVPVSLKRKSDGSSVVVKAVEDGDRINPPLLHPSLDSGHRLTLRLEIYGVDFDQIVSNTHAIDVHRPGKDSRSAVVTLSRGETIPDGDFSMSIYLRKSKNPAASFVTSPGKEFSHGMLSVFPPTAEREGSMPAEPREVIFLVDTSGSMSGTSIGQAKAGLNLCLDMLRPGDHFTIVRFSSGYSSFSPDLREATVERMSAARRYVDGLQSGGGTEMQKALKHVLSFPRRSSRMRLVVFLTDGCVGNEDSLMRLLGESLGDARIFAFAIGSAPNEYLVRKMAELGRGQARFIRSHEDIGDVMADFFRTLNEPVLTDLKLTWEKENGATEEVAFYPDPPPDVYFERPLQVVMRYRPDFRGRFVIDGRRGGEDVRYSFPVGEEEGIQHEAIDKLFGRARIGDLMYRWIRAGTTREKYELKGEVLDTALTYQLVSKFTSRVAVEERVERRDGKLVMVPVKVPLPRGWSPGAFFPTATSDWAFLALGLLMVLAGMGVVFSRSRGVED